MSETQQQQAPASRSWWLDYPTRTGFQQAAIKEALRMAAEKSYSVGKQRIVGSVYGRQP